ncbi:hypothetical protein [Gordonia jacobaea]|uniref:hypothetical protein n=1 Tax=Gordonia jacobaea TaxID=122202 RepID=UPI003D755979
MQYTDDIKYRRRDNEDPRAHYIEESVKVYLMRHPDGRDAWVIDPSCLDGYALDSSLDRPLSEECECGNEADCERVEARMAAAHLPNAHNLLEMLADTLGYTLTKQ